MVDASLSGKVEVPNPALSFEPVSDVRQRAARVHLLTVCPKAIGQTDFVDAERAVPARCRCHRSNGRDPRVVVGDGHSAYPLKAPDMKPRT